MLSYVWSYLITQVALHCNAVNCCNIPQEACQLNIKCVLSLGHTVGQWQEAFKSRNPVSHHSEDSVSIFFFFRLRTSWHQTSNTTNSEYPPLHLCNMEFYTFPLKPSFWFEVLTPEVGWRVLTTHSLLSGTHRQLPHTGDWTSAATFNLPPQTSAEVFSYASRWFKMN